jgi:hypothetical protein
MFAKKHPIITSTLYRMFWYNFLRGGCFMNDVFELVDKKVLTTINLLFSRDIYLLKKNSSERSLSHRLAVYLEEQFHEWCVDCEYNRNLADKKILYDLKTHSGRQGRSVYPDIIVHHRGTNNNLLIIEIKKGLSTDDFDLKKLQFYKSQHDLHYKYALFLGIGTGETSGQFYKEWV